MNTRTLEKHKGAAPHVESIWQLCNEARVTDGLGMPEAPEVEAVVRTLRPLVEGRSIARVRVNHAIAIKPQSTAVLRRRVEGTHIAGVDRRGKYLLLKLDRGWLALHFKFDGQLLWFDQPNEKAMKDRHWDVAFDFDGGTLAFVDRRHLGRVRWHAEPEELPGIKALGPDAFSEDFTLSLLIEICRRRPRPVKLLLMDQTRIAGVGNIYATEALWHARIDPWRSSDRLAPGRFRSLHKAVVSVLARALECCLHPPPDFRNPQWWFSGVDTMLRVYGREGRACRRCGTKIRRVEQGGRSTYFCPHCQHA